MWTYVRIISVTFLMGAVFAASLPAAADILVNAQQVDTRRLHPEGYAWQETQRQALHAQGAEEARRDPNVERWLRNIAWPLCDQDENQMKE